MDNQEPEIILPVRGDCGIVHPSFKDWQDCKACGAILERSLLDCYIDSRIRKTIQRPFTGD